MRGVQEGERVCESSREPEESVGVRESECE